MKMIANIKVSNGQPVNMVLKDKNSYTVSLDTKSTLDLGPVYPELMPGNLAEDSIANPKSVRDGMWIIL